MKVENGILFLGGTRHNGFIIVDRILGAYVDFYGINASENEEIHTANLILKDREQGFCLDDGSLEEMEALVKEVKDLICRAD